jgi:Flp pilus assembly protein TadD
MKVPRINCICLRTLLLLVVLAAPAWGADNVQSPTAEPGVRPGTATGGKADPGQAIAGNNAKDEPATAPALVRRGYLQLDKGAFAEATQSFDEALKINPHSYDAKTGKAAILARSGKLKEAEQSLREALVLNPNPVRTHYELGLIYEKLGEFDKAVAEYKEGINKHEQGRL